MTNLTDLQQLEHWGYTLIPTDHPACPSYSGIVVMMQEHPDPNAFLSPVSLHIHTVEKDGHAYWETIHADNKWLPFHSLCPGKFHIRDTQGNETTFFSFGANIELEQQQGKTIFTICSAAPILELSQNRTTLATDFAEEVECLLARLEAKWMIQHEDHLDFFAYMTHNFSPLQLYAASIRTLLTHFNEMPALRHSNPKLHHLLEEESAAKDNLQWPETPHIFDDLFVSTAKTI